MIRSAALPARSVLTAGLSATVVGAAVLMPVAAAAPARIASPAVALTAAVDSLALVDAQAVAAATSLGGFVKEAYNTIEPWVAYGFELVDYALSWVPGLWWIAPGVDLAYFSIEPLVQAGVYAFADVLDLDFAQIGPDIQAGLQEAADNFVTYGLAWINSLIPLPPLPPFPPSPPFASASLSTNPAASSLAAAKRTSQPLPAAVTAEPSDTAPAAVQDTAPETTAPADGVSTPVGEESAAVREAAPVQDPRPRRQASRAAAVTAPDSAATGTADSDAPRKAVRAARAGREG